MLILRGISHSSAIIGSDSPQSNNTYVRHIMSVVSRLPQPTSVPVLPVLLTAPALIRVAAALAPLLNRGIRVSHQQSARRLWPDWRMHATDRTDPCDSPRMGVKNITISNHYNTPLLSMGCHVLTKQSIFSH